VHPHLDLRAAGELPRPLHDVTDQITEIEVLRLELEATGRQSRYVEQAVDQRGQAERLLEGDVELLARALRAVVGAAPEQPLQAFELQAQCRERRAQLMRGYGEELVSQLDGAPQRVLRLALIGDVRLGAEPTHDGAALVPHGNDLREKPAVLSGF